MWKSHINNEINSCICKNRFKTQWTWWCMLTNINGNLCLIIFAFYHYSCCITKHICSNKYNKIKNSKINTIKQFQRKHACNNSEHVSMFFFLGFWVQCATQYIITNLKIIFSESTQNMKVTLWNYWYPPCASPQHSTRGSASYKPQYINLHACVKCSFLFFIMFLSKTNKVEPKAIWQGPHFWQ